MKLYAFLVVLLLVAPSFAFIVTVPDETVVVPVGNTSQINVRVDSSKANEIAFTILDSKPWITQSTSLIKIGQDETQYLKIFVTPFDDTAAGVYRITLMAESLMTGEEQKKFIFINVNKITILKIDKIEINGIFAPTGQVTITGFLKNDKPNTLQDVNVKALVSSPSSELIEFEQNVDSIEAGQTKNITYSFTLPRQSESGLYTVIMRISSEDGVQERTRSFTVDNQAKFTESMSQQPLLFGFSRYATVTNIGNTKGDDIVSDTLSPFESAFYSGEQPASANNGEFKWVIKDVNPGETKTLYYKVDYTSLFLFIIVLIAAVWLFLFKVRTVRIKKFILEKKFIEEGEEFTVGVEVMNSTGSKIDGATIKDFVPSVFNIKECEGVKPVKKKTAAGTELVWKLKDLHKNEERILSYKILPVFGVHGTIRLPQSSVVFKRGKKDAEIKSGYANIGIETESYGEKRSIFRRKK